MASANSTKGVLLVTGANRGIGKAIAILGAQAGYSVAVHYGQYREEADTVCHAIHGLGQETVAVCADMADEDAITNLFKTVDHALGPVNALVNNAGGIIAICEIAEISAEIVQRALMVNLAGPILCCREAVRRMSTRRGGKGGAIVNISSMAAVLGGLPHEVHYAASKGGVDSFTIGLAREVATEGVRVNAIRPGVIDTPIHERHGGVDFLDRFKSNLPMQRPGQPEEIAEAALWLLSPAASYVTGSILNVSGGR